MTSTAVAPDYLTASFDQLQAQNGVPDWLRDLRQKGLNSFRVQGFPTTRDEDWRFTDVTPIVKAQFQLSPAATAEVTAGELAEYTFQDVAPTLVVFVDGVWSRPLSRMDSMPDGVTVQTLTQALAGDQAELLRAHLDGQTQAAGNPFAALNTGFLAEGAVIRVGAGKQLSEPIHLLYVSTGAAEGLMMHPRNLIVAERGASAIVLESYVGLAESTYLCNPVTEIVVGENARLDHYRTQRESLSAYHVSTTQVHMDRDAHLTSHAVSIGGSLTRNAVNAVLDGEGCECTLNGLYLGAGRQLVDNHTIIEHAKPRCQSHEIYKGILDDRAQGVFNGRIHVHHDAQKTDARQTNRALLLSDRARINTKPELLIFADDVKCTHGATIGQLDPDALFYLQARGIGRDQARAMLTAAFGGEAIDDMQVEPVREHLSNMMRQRFTRMEV